jgi:N-succinyl-L-ornithine transcarbamylase
MNVMVMNFTSEGWTLDFEDGAIMNSGASEHIKEAAAVVSQYCDIVAIKSFCRIGRQRKDNAETVLMGFLKIRHCACCEYGKCNRTSLQSLVTITMAEHKTEHRPK